jgi:Family of unknown function (DUF5754)
MSSKRSTYHIQYRERNREAINRRQRETRAANREAYNAKMREYRKNKVASIVGSGINKADLPLDKVRAKAVELGIEGDLDLSTRKDKKYMITRSGDAKPKVLHFGYLGLEDFTQHEDEERRKRFHTRFRNNKGYNNPDSPLFYSARLLW